VHDVPPRVSTERPSATRLGATTLRWTTNLGIMVRSTATRRMILTLEGDRFGCPAHLVAPAWRLS
jgi:hypothetical protein